LLKISRLDHGNRALEDQNLIARLTGEGMALTVCPLSNLKLCVIKDMKKHPLKKMLELGLKATVNSDDPAYFGGYMNDNYKAVTEALSLEKPHLLILVRNSIDASFLTQTEKNNLLDQVKAYATSA
ncbi:MAG: adenosine deaminase, partial [Alphaproteobacteria bacterium]|nr:adenosine deaminase [Alphaproteobacteria bacterium]